MTIPFREFTEFDERNLRAEDPDSHNYTTISDWDTTQYPNRRRFGEHKFIGGTHYEKEIPVMRVKGGGQLMVPDGLELMLNIELDLQFSQEAWTGPDRILVLHKFIRTSAVVNTENGTVNWENFSGRYKDKVGSVVWRGVTRGISPAGPERTEGIVEDIPSILSTDTFFQTKIVWRAYSGGSLFTGYSGELTNEYGGIWFHMTFYSGPPYIIYALTDGDEVWLIVKPQLLKVNYLNPITNSISNRIWHKDGGTAVILTGSNYHPAEADLNASVTPGITWNYWVDEIDIIGLQGQGTTTITLFAGDFVVDSESQITIAATPVLTPGTYELKLKSNEHSALPAHRSEQYAGDWRTDSSKRITPGERFVILVTGDEVTEDNPGGSLILTEWSWKDRDGNLITEFLAPIDVRARSVFYHGRILSQTNFSREVNDQTGMFSVGDMTFEIANNDKHYSSLLATYFLKNQFVGIFHARRNHPEAWKTSMIKMIVDDYEMEGTVFRVMCKDVTNKYFQVTIPRNIIEDDFYPSAHEAVLGQPIPDCLGKHSLFGQTPGAVEALCVNTLTFKYVCAAGSLHSVLQVYSEGVPQTGGGVDYTLSYEDGGRTYITFVLDQEEKKVTFNCNGYSHALWDSGNGYVQNPAYVILFVLAFLLEIPQSKINLGSFDEVAALMGTLEVHTAGRWIGQEAVSGETVIQELLLTYGAKLFVDKDGKLKIDKKDISNYTTDLFIFDQIHCLKPAKRTFGLNEAVNVIKSKYDYYPTASFFKSVVEARNETSIVNFEAEREPDSEFSLKWTNSPTLAQLRTVEELVKYSEGYYKGHFLLPFDMVDELDIMDNFRFQDPFGIVDGGGGEFGRYFYVISLQPNHIDLTLDMIAVDLTWLIEQESGSGSG